MCIYVHVQAYIYVNMNTETNNNNTNFIFNLSEIQINEMISNNEKIEHENKAVPMPVYPGYVSKIPVHIFNTYIDIYV
jgi:hypothetical protein